MSRYPYLTLVFKQPISDDVRAVLERAEWTAASHSHVMHERDALEAELAQLRAQQKQAEACNAVTQAEEGIPSSAAGLLRRQWIDAYAAFRGVFDTPVARRTLNDAFAEDVRVRMRAVDALLTGVHGAAASPDDAAEPRCSSGSLSERVRAGVEAAPWVVAEIQRLERSREQLTAALGRTVAHVVQLQDDAQALLSELERHPERRRSSPELAECVSRLVAAMTGPQPGFPALPSGS